MSEQDLSSNMAELTSDPYVQYRQQLIDARNKLMQTRTKIDSQIKDIDQQLEAEGVKKPSNVHNLSVDPTTSISEINLDCVHNTRSGQPPFPTGLEDACVNPLSSTSTETDDDDFDTFRFIRDQNDVAVKQESPDEKDVEHSAQELSTAEHPFEDNGVGLANYQQAVSSDQAALPTSVLFSSTLRSTNSDKDGDRSSLPHADIGCNSEQHLSGDNATIERNPSCQESLTRVTQDAEHLAQPFGFGDRRLLKPTRLTAEIVQNPSSLIELVAAEQQVQDQKDRNRAEDLRNITPIELDASSFSIQSRDWSSGPNQTGSHILPVLNSPSQHVLSSFSPLQSDNESLFLPDKVSRKRKEPASPSIEVKGRDRSGSASSQSPQPAVRRRKARKLIIAAPRGVDVASGHDETAVSVLDAQPKTKRSRMAKASVRGHETPAPLPVSTTSTDRSKLQSVGLVASPRLRRRRSSSGMPASMREVSPMESGVDIKPSRPCRHHVSKHPGQYVVPEYGRLRPRERHYLELRYCAHILTLIASPPCVHEPPRPLHDENLAQRVRRRFIAGNMATPSPTERDTLQVTPTKTNPHDSFTPYHNALDFADHVRHILKQYVKMGYCGARCPFQRTPGGSRESARTMCWRMRLETQLDDKLMELKRCLKTCEEEFAVDDMKGKVACVDQWAGGWELPESGN